MDQKKFIKISNVVGLILSFLLIVIFSIVGFYLKDNTYMYGTLICIPFLFFTIFISGKVVDTVFAIAKNKIKKWKIILFSMFLYICKYMIMVLPLLIGVMTNHFTNGTYFNLVSLILGVLSYPLTTLIVQFCFIERPKKTKVTA